MDHRGYEKRADKSAQAVGWLVVIILIGVAGLIWVFAGGQPSPESESTPIARPGLSSPP